MLSKERMMRIMSEIEQKSFVSIKELMVDLQASRSSIMRDLIELENQGLIQRERGGASLKNMDMTLTSFNEISVAEKENLHIEEKKQICLEASKSIHDGDCIYIDAGTTPAYLVDHILNKQVQIVTPSTYLIRKIPASFKGNIYLLGGEFNKSYDMSYGSLTIQMIRQFNFDHAYISTNGVNLETGEVYIFDFNVGAVKQEILKHCRRSDLLIDSSKYDAKAICTWANLDDFHTVYTNSYPENMDVRDNFVVCE